MTKYILISLSNVYETLYVYALDLSYGFYNFRFGEPQSLHDAQGFPGLNSGVILFRLDRMRKNSLYNRLLEAEAVTSLANKYSFKVILILYLNHLKPELYLNNILKFTFCITENITLLCYKDGPVNAVLGNNDCLL
jgi:hypothetical protein